MSEFGIAAAYALKKGYTLGRLVVRGSQCNTALPQHAFQFQIGNDVRKRFVSVGFAPGIKGLEPGGNDNGIDLTGKPPGGAVFDLFDFSREIFMARDAANRAFGQDLDILVFNDLLDFLIDQTRTAPDTCAGGLACVLGGITAQVGFFLDNQSANAGIGEACSCGQSGNTAAND